MGKVLSRCLTTVNPGYEAGGVKRRLRTLREEGSLKQAQTSSFRLKQTSFPLFSPLFGVIPLLGEVRKGGLLPLGEAPKVHICQPRAVHALLVADTMSACSGRRRRGTPTNGWWEGVHTRVGTLPTYPGRHIQPSQDPLGRHIALSGPL